MSMTLLVPICATLLSAADLNGELQRAGFDMVVEDFDPATHTGFLPVRLEGQLSGFEYRVDEAAGFEAPVEFAACSRLVSLDFSIDHEVVAAFAFSAILAQSNRSGVYDPQEDQWLTPDQAFESARIMSSAVQRPFYHPGGP